MPTPYASNLEALKPYFWGPDDQLSTAASDFTLSASTAVKQDIAGTPAGRVLAAMGTSRAFGVFWQAFLDEYVEGAFRWVGSQGVNSARVTETLDGTRTSGECAILARCFFALWRCPPPYGVGGSGLDFVNFDNDDDVDGFIAPHPAGGIRGLGPNVLHPHGGQGDPRNCLYNWGNHKVLRYGGTLYDPTYRCTYTHTREMVAFAFTGVSRHVCGELVTQVRCVTANPARGWKTGDLMYLRSTADVQVVGPYRAIAGWDTEDNHA